MSRRRKKSLPPEEPAEKFIFKFTLVGDFNVGKTSIFARLKGRDIHDDSFLTSFGLDFHLENFRFGELEVTIQLWDLPGYFTPAHHRPTYYKGAHGILFVYDVTNRESFELLQEWVDIIELNVNRPYFSDYFVIGNKIDLIDSIPSEVTVPPAEGRDFAISIGALFAETSALTGEGIFDTLIHFLLVRLENFYEEIFEQDFIEWLTGLTDNFDENTRNAITKTLEWKKDPGTAELVDYIKRKSKDKEIKELERQLTALSRGSPTAEQLEPIKPLLVSLVFDPSVSDKLKKATRTLLRYLDL